MTRHEDLTVNHKILALVRKCWECLVTIQIESFNWGLTMPYLWENGRKWIQSQRCLAFLRQWSWRRLCHWWERAVFGPAQRFQKRNTICIYQAEFFVLRRGRWPRPWILWRDGGDKKRQEKVQVEEDSEKSDSTGHREARPPVYSCGFPHRPLWGVKCCTGQILYETLPQLLFSEKKKESDQSLVPISSVVDKTGTVWSGERKSDIQYDIFNWCIEWNVIHLNSTIIRGCPVSLKFIFWHSQK